MKKKIKWGIIGTGNIAHSFARDFAYVRNGEIPAAASRTITKAAAFAEKYRIKKSYGSYEELFQDDEIDVVYIATPHNLHFSNSFDAMKNGKAVLCEKPITTSVAEFSALIETARSREVYLMEAMWTYFLPAIIQAKQWADTGKIGKIRYIKADFGFKAGPADQRLFDPNLAGGALLDIGIYPIALASLFYNQSPTDISVKAEFADTGVDVAETMIATYPKGGLANLSSSFLYEMPNEAQIIGEKGYITIPDFFMAKKCLLFQDGKQTDYFLDKNEGVGYHYETEAVNRDLIAGNKQSDIMPWSASLRLQEFMERVKAQF